MLADGKLIEGVVAETADKVTVRRGAIEQVHAKDKVRFVAASKDEVYQQMLAKVPPADAAARMKLAKWMLFAGMREQARREALEVVKLEPKNAAAADMARSLEESLRRFPEDGKPAAEPPAAPATQAPAAPAVVEPEFAVAPDVAAAFPLRVQPILSNLCAGCHANPAHGSSFKLAASEGFENRPQVTAQNLKAAVAQVRSGDAASSPLLVKAAAAHGGMKQSAFHGKAAAYATLEAWVYVAAGTPAAKAAAVPPIPPAANGPPAAPLPAAPAPAAGTPTPPLPVVPPPPGIPGGTTPPGFGEWKTENWPVHPDARARLADPPKADGPRFGEDIKPTPPGGPDPANAGAAVDEFDPSVFNRAVHPRR